MNKKIGALISFILLLLLVCGFGYSLLRSSKEDKLAYLQLKNRKKDHEEKRAPSEIRQERKGVYKEIHLTHGEQRIELKIFSESSDLELLSNDTKKELVEHLQKATAYLQEELYYLLPDGKKIKMDEAKNYSSTELRPMQSFKLLIADKAVYNYQTDLFAAENVTIKKYVCPGHKLPRQMDTDKPIMTGTADLIELSLKDNQPAFKAYGFKATYHLWE